MAESKVEFTVESIVGVCNSTAGNNTLGDAGDFGIGDDGGDEVAGVEYEGEGESEGEGEGEGDKSIILSIGPSGDACPSRVS